MSDDNETLSYGPDGYPTETEACVAKEVTPQRGPRLYYVIGAVRGRALFNKTETAAADLARHLGGEPLFRFYAVRPEVFHTYLAFLRTNNEARYLQAQREFAAHD